MQDYTLEQIDNRFDKLPLDIKEAINSLDMTKIVVEIGQNNNLHIDQIGELLDVVGLTMLGFNNPDRFVELLKERMEITDEQTKNVIKEVNDKVFVAIRESIKRIHEEHTKETGEIDVLRPAEIINPVQTDISHDEVLDRDKVLDEIENPEKIEVTTSIPINIIKDKSVIIPEIDNNVPLIVETKNEIPTANIMENKLTATTKAPIQEKKIEDGEHQADPYREQIQ
ncbi:hypothetical protein A3I18_02075 [Candidatus Campbellbacteria bacterium RIFCSPLOWO2_02_FULL_35_11]|uniref:Uncharacterized protein n=2 Tax=Candidatus Campbelliibacteriota TaxID=1752727 RepID=A0A1F5EQC6_9BACT|nr:MAG: hypothetical protein A3E89_00155 [Candidatus Campbellbacteria bacterium RIFCSPHIGHO2_12_FULL_35_10]OGD70571.1 MAG: hypothetical protein A3I18_02075 [Candidatus Campbellbacteria bacterium RIFCSPLOWO2_02_FULL_35_11]OGH65904.1 MAG: hypothetical protein A3B83_04995 [Candidatus Magasanikbacteria bacterium RIFCSPHIGHO2_02_FULL_33_17]